MLLKLKKDSFLKMRFIIQLSCVMLRFPIVLVFSEKHGFSNIPCVNVRAVAKKQRKIFEQMKKLVFLEKIFHATVFLAFKIFRNAYMSRAWSTGNGHLLAPRATR